ncbi:unnamed protein product, partial [Pylaiella littoralis]
QSKHFVAACDFLSWVLYVDPARCTRARIAGALSSVPRRTHAVVLGPFYFFIGVIVAVLPVARTCRRRGSRLQSNRVESTSWRFQMDRERERERDDQLGERCTGRCLT